MPQQSLHKAADYFEPLIQVRFRKAMQALRKKVSINALAMSMGNVNQAKSVVTRKLIETELQPLRRILHDAFRKGGRVGADVVNKL